MGNDRAGHKVHRLGLVFLASVETFWKISMSIWIDLSARPARNHFLSSSPGEELCLCAVHIVIVHHPFPWIAISVLYVPYTIIIFERL